MQSRSVPALENGAVNKHFLQWEPTTRSWRFEDRKIISEATVMSLLFYMTLFIVMCVFGWSVRGGS